MIFLTVGTQLPFDRLCKIVDDAIEIGYLTEPVYGQIGNSNYIPKNYEYTNFLKPSEFREIFSSCDYVISHAGMGGIISALEYSKKIIVMARQAKFGEHRNDHQVATARSFASFPTLRVISSVEDLRCISWESASNYFDLADSLEKRKKLCNEVRRFIDNE